MYKDDEKDVSLNGDDFTLTDFEEDFNIEEIPTIEEMLSIDKEEFEQIQKLSSFSSSSDDIEEVYKPNNSEILQEDTSPDTDVNTPLESGGGIRNENFNSSSNDINVLSEENTPVSDEHLLYTEDTILADNSEEETADLRVTDENLSDINDVNAGNTDINMTESISAIQYEQTYDIFAQIDALLDDKDISDIIPEQTVYDNTADTQDNATEEILQEKYMRETALDKKDLDNKDIAELSYTDEEIHINEDIISEQDDTSAEYGQTASLINEDTDNEELHEFLHNEDIISEQTVIVNTADNQDNTTEEIPQKKYQSAFNPIKYMRETALDKKDLDNKDITELSYTDEEIHINEDIISEQDDTSAEYEQTASLINEDTDNEEVFETLYNEDTDNTINDVTALEEENAEAEENILTKGKAKTIILGAVVCAFLIGSCITAISVFNRKSAEEIAALDKNDVTIPLEAVNSTDTTPPIVEKNTNVDADIPDINKIEQPKVETITRDVIKEEIQKRITPIDTESYLSVSKIQWQVPHYLSYSPNMNSYLQKAGKSIKLQLSSDLLLVNEYAYSNMVKVNLKLNNSGVLQNTNILASSGSKQIDDIVLQSVKSTLNVLRLPADDVKTPELNLTITIYF